MDNMDFNNYLKLVSFNCKHFKTVGPKNDFMCDIMNDCDIMLIQEHCLFESHIKDKIKTIGNSLDVVGCSAMDESVPLIGRPHGGCAIAYKTTINATISEVECIHKRLCGLLLNYKENISILILNAYMPVDNNRVDENHTIYIEVLSEIHQIIHKLDPAHVVFGGDLNTDLIRNSPHTRALMEFIQEVDFTPCINVDIANVPYTYIGPVSTSRIDHFMSSSALTMGVVSCEIIDNHLYSDHVPIKICYNIDTVHTHFVESEVKEKIAWHKASECQINRYKQDCEKNLRNIIYKNDLITCSNSGCDAHLPALNMLYSDIIHACVSAADTHIPKTGPNTNNNKTKTIAGWNDHVEALREESLMWHWQWRDCGQPHDGPVAEMHKISRARYHRAVRNIIRNSDAIRCEKMAEAIADNRSRDLMREVRKIKGKNKPKSGTIDSLSTDDDISDLFGTKYKHLYNSVPYDINEMNLISDDINNRLMESKHQYTLTVADVQLAINRLKLGKCDGEEGLNSDHIIHGPHLLTVMLTSVFNCMIVHGICPFSMIDGTMLPIPKCKRKLLSCSDNYRAITLGSIICKVFDWVILLKEHKALCSSDLQFGFKPNVSTTHCTFATTEIISYYNFNRSNVYTALLDASKAFDRVNYCKLFRQLLNRNMSPAILRLLLFMYTKQTLQVRWGSKVSEKFTVQNGVKQGGVLSPILFAVYMDGLFTRLSSSGVGCHIGSYFAGGFGYADDLKLLAPSLTGLQRLVVICENYANDYDITFNGSKTLFLIFKGRECPNVETCHITVNHVNITNVNAAPHLGHQLDANNKESIVQAAKAHFWSSFNLLRADFGHVKSFVQCKLFKQYCCSFYGAAIWPLSSQSVRDICVAWRRALRMIWRVPPMTHCDIMPIISDCKPLEVSLQQRFCKFYLGISQHGSKLLKTIVAAAHSNPMSVMCNNYIDITNMCKTSIENCYNILLDNWICTLHNNVITNINVLRDMLNVRDGFMTCDYLSQEDINAIIEDICVN